MRHAHRSGFRSLTPAMALACLATPALAVFPTTDIPMVLIGAPFQPEAPKPLPATHPLYRRIEIAEIEALPAVVKSTRLNFIGAAKRDSIDTAFHDTMARMNMVADMPAAARFHLSARWIRGGAPFRIASRNTATVGLHYRLTRIDTGKVLFDRDVVTSVHGGGADASMRDNGAMRAAIGTNFASVANCLDHAAYGTTPADCALTPAFTVSVERYRR